MLHYWPMDEPAGNEITDILAVNHDLTFIATADAANLSLADGIFSRARDLSMGDTADGPLFHLKTAPSGANVQHSSWAWSIWFYFDVYPTSGADVLLNWSSVQSFSSLGEHALTLVFEPSFVYAKISREGSTTGQSRGIASSLATAGGWHNIIVTGTAGSLPKIFFDGGNEAVFSHNAIYADLKEAAHAHFGHKESSFSGTTFEDRPFQGLATDWGFWGRELSLADAQAIWAGGVGEVLIPSSAPTPLSKTATLRWDLLNAIQSDATLIWNTDVTPVTKSATLRWEVQRQPFGYVYNSTAAAIADGMLHYWPMDEQSGQTIADLLQVDFDGTLIASDDAADNSIVDGGYGTARHMAQGGAGGKGPQFHIQTPPDGTGPSYPSWTCAFWFNASGALDYPMMFLDWSNTANNASGGLLVYPQPTDAIIFNNSSASISFSGVGPGEDHVIIITCDNGLLFAYMDGSIPVGGGTNGFGGLDLDSAAEIHVGHGKYDTGVENPGVNARMWDLGFWGRALNETEVANIVNGGTGNKLVNTNIPVISQTSMLWDALNPFQQSATLRWRIESLIASARRPVGVQYRAHITGGADSQDDYALRLRSLSARLKSGTPSTVTCVCAWQSDIAAALALRPNGDLAIVRVVVHFDGFESSATIATVGVDELRLDGGGTSRSIGITGSRQTTNSTPKTVALTGVSYRSERGGSLQLRARVDPAAKAGDTFTNGADSFVASSVIVSVANGRESMEVVE